MSVINNEKFCPICIKRGTCMWEDKLLKLNGSKKNPIFLDVTVNGCEAFVFDENIEVEEPDQEE